MGYAHKIVLALACSVVAVELGLLLYYHQMAFDWLSHNLWVVVIPFLKVIIKKLITLKFILFLKAIFSLLINLLKLLLLKLFKTLAVRYGVFFSQKKWRWIRWCKVMFLRRGKQLFRILSRFWALYNTRQRWFILIAFFPVVIVLFLMGLSFNVTRKTMVQKTQETAIFQTAISASNSSRGVQAWVSRQDRKVLKKIKDLITKSI